LLPFMDLGMPQSEQILYKLKIQAAPPKTKLRAADQNDKKVQWAKLRRDFPSISRSGPGNWDPAVSTQGGKAFR